MTLAPNAAMDPSDYGHVPASRRATFSTPSVLSLVIALASFAANSPVWAGILSVLAAILGAIGVLVAIMPGTRGGLLSLFAIVLGLVGFFIAVLRLIISFA